MPTDEDKGKTRDVEILEVEDEEQRRARMHDVFARLDASSRPHVLPRPVLPNLNGQSSTPLEPNSELLSRVQAFLPQLADSNAELARRVQGDPSAVDIENVDAGGAYIEMGSNLGLGVFEQRHNASSRSSSDAETGSDADADSDSSTDDSDTSTSSSDSDDDGTSSDSDSSSSDPESAPSRRPIKPLPKRKPQITVLGEDSRERGS
ncbi:hypothetical protein FOMPIDRAFT_1033425 [Fomitopsis schrenkii]|uniref:Uncharacterized protein n=1 Tax=Fomitopsis schrenkii TaxID=2126942 RepID=S8EXP4_FOMSC|nr:hypothetical protein FOMPIDRAFT_1033425 [Fomitopsis schrenkii]